MREITPCQSRLACKSYRLRPFSAPCQRRTHGRTSTDSWRPKLPPSRAQDEGESGAPVSSSKYLTNILRRKKDQLQVMLSEYSEEALMERLDYEGKNPQPPSHLQHRFAGLIPNVRMREGRPVLVIELGRSTPSQTSADLADLAKQFEAAGADALAVPTDAADTPTGLADLLAVCRAVKCPVIRRDWVLHPLQVLEAKEAGASGVMGIVTSILGKHAALYSSYAAQLGVDCPVEVVNLEELQAMEKLGVPFFGMNLSVALSVGIPGFRAEVAAGLLNNLPHGVSSMMGAASMEEIKQAMLAGADIILVKKELIAPIVSEMPPDSKKALEVEMISQRAQKASGALFGPSDLGTNQPETLSNKILNFISEIKYATSGDD